MIFSTRVPAALTAGLLASFCAWASVVSYPAPAGASLSGDYKVFVDNNPVDVYRAKADSRKGDYSFAYFDFSDSVTVKVAPMHSGRILPESYGITYRLVKDTAVFRLYRPCNISVEPDGGSELLLFAGAPEKGPPRQGDTGVIYYGPGLHTAGVINLGSNQTLYLAPGAVVKGGVRATGSNITMCGRGILDGDGMSVGHSIVQARNCSRIRIRGVILKMPGGAITPYMCDSISIENVKICNSAKINDDGIGPHNCVDWHIRGCFVRADDDCICVKADDYAWPSRRILVEDCVLWSDRANIFRIGHECAASGTMADGLVVRNIEVLHTTEVEEELSEYWANSVFAIQSTHNVPMGNMLFENVNVNGGEAALIRLLSMIPIVGPQRWGKAGKYLKNVAFRNIRYTGGHQAAPVYITGFDSTHYVDSITLENVRRMDRCTDLGSENVTVGPFAWNVAFACTPDTVSLVSPPGGQTFAAPGACTLVAEVAGVYAPLIRKVVFLEGSTIVGEDASPADGYTCSLKGRAAGSYSFRARAVGKDGTIAESQRVGVSVGPMRRAERPTAVLSGLVYNYYEGMWTELPDFTSMTPVARGTVSTITLDAIKRRDDHFAVVFTGYIDAPVSGRYTFYAWSDDGVRVSIGDRKIINDPGVHAPLSHCGTVALQAGKHPISISYFDNIGGDILRVKWWTPGLAKEEIPACRLWHAAESVD